MCILKCQEEERVKDGKQEGGTGFGTWEKEVERDESVGSTVTKSTAGTTEMMVSKVWPAVPKESM